MVADWMEEHLDSCALWRALWGLIGLIRAPGFRQASSAVFPARAGGGGREGTNAVVNCIRILLLNSAQVEVR